LSINVSQNKINTVAHEITHKRSRDFEAWSISSCREQKLIKTPAITLLQVKTNITTSAKSTKTILFDKKIFSKNSPKNHMNFDKTSTKNRNPQQQKVSRNATKKTAQLCGKSAQLATLVPCFAYLQRQVAKLECWLVYCWSLLRNNNMATNLHVFTSSYGNRRFVACECWTQVMQGDSEFWERIATYFIASCAKRSMISLKNPLLVWDWTLLPIMRMSVHRQKVSKDKQGFIERVFDCFGRDLRRLQLLFLNDAGKSCYCR